MTLEYNYEAIPGTEVPWAAPHSFIHQTFQYQELPLAWKIASWSETQSTAPVILLTSDNSCVYVWGVCVWCVCMCVSNRIPNREGLGSRNLSRDLRD